MGGACSVDKGECVFSVSIELLRMTYNSTGETSDVFKPTKRCPDKNNYQENSLIQTLIFLEKRRSIARARACLFAEREGEMRAQECRFNLKLTIN